MRVAIAREECDSDLELLVPRFPESSQLGAKDWKAVPVHGYLKAKRSILMVSVGTLVAELQWFLWLALVPLPRCGRRRLVTTSH